MVETPNPEKVPSNESQLFQDERTKLAKCATIKSLGTTAGVSLGSLFWIWVIGTLFTDHPPGIFSGLPSFRIIICIEISMILLSMAVTLPWQLLTVEGTIKFMEQYRVVNNSLVDRKVEQFMLRMESARSIVPPVKIPATFERRQVLSDAGCENFWRSIGWWDFEIAVLLAFEKLGYQATATPPCVDGGLDGIIENADGRAGVQSKHYGRREFVGVETVRAFCGALMSAGLRRGFFVTTGYYTRSAESFIAMLPDIKIELLTIKDLTKMGIGYELTAEVISNAKERWAVPQEPPPHIPQGPRAYRNYYASRRRY